MIRGGSPPRGTLAGRGKLSVSRFLPAPGISRHLRRVHWKRTAHESDTLIISPGGMSVKLRSVQFPTYV